MRQPTGLEKRSMALIPVEFIKDWQKPLSAGGRLIKRGYRTYLTIDSAEALKEGGFIRVMTRNDEEE